MSQTTITTIFDQNTIPSDIFDGKPVDCVIDNNEGNGISFLRSSRPFVIIKRGTSGILQYLKSQITSDRPPSAPESICNTNAECEIYFESHHQERVRLGWLQRTVTLTSPIKLLKISLITTIPLSECLLSKLFLHWTKRLSMMCLITFLLEEKFFIQQRPR